MRIERVRAHIVRLPADEPLADGKVAPGAARDIVAVKVATTDGIEAAGRHLLSHGGIAPVTFGQRKTRKL